MVPDAVEVVREHIEAAQDERKDRATQVEYRRMDVDGVEIFYREAGPRTAPAVVLLHGYPASSHMFRKLIPELAGNYHVIAPDYPGFGYSSAPSVDRFEYTFDNLTAVMDAFLTRLGLRSYALYVQDYGAPVGYRIAVKHPERVTALVIQNGNAYTEGLDNAFWAPLKTYWKERTEANAAPLREFLTLESTRWLYVHGTRNPAAVSPDAWFVDQTLLDRPGNAAIQLALFYDYRTNPQRYPQWQDYFRTHQPPALVVWGKNDTTFPVAGAEPYKRDLKNIEFHLLDTGHFALEEDGERIAALMRAFLKKNIPASQR